jgi:rhodanese-related sulfurtransferase
MNLVTIDLVGSFYSKIKRFYFKRINVNFIIENWQLVFVALASGVALLLPTLLSGGAGSISCTDAVLLMNKEKANVVDVRRADEFSTGTIAGAKHVEITKIEANLASVVKNKEAPLVLICASGARSQGAVRLAQKLGYTRVFSMSGGLKAWREANLPVTKAS